VTRQRRLVGALAVAVALALLPLAAGQMGLLQGRPPATLGVRDGRLAPPSPTPNSVSSQADLWPDHPQRESARIAPLAYRGDGAAALARLRGLIEGTPGAQVHAGDADYLHAAFETRWLRFVDDAEFWLDRDAGVIHVRSASRLGRGDFGTNRARIEALRERFSRAAGNGR
jgi:uncharacterized protein (DUF1499 family)